VGRWGEPNEKAVLPGTEHAAFDLDAASADTLRTGPALDRGAVAFGDTFSK
jgi:hypothetical protein